ncbi:L-threonylcarbamoyladenylate synthase [Pseudanabaena sp. PCC 6802]|uniref:L-threonylcarbamoyladenylate synthase n=1 Tax=Pseudanabaena sp. PCC 6802 TaxID=118173 RepID=UPI00034CBC8C|nr:L-threonylcarbamoyladenylate synthase [Pseudanabaena sp. PCC 6802]
MAIIHKLHPESPQSRSIEQIASALRDGAVMLYPTDTVYAIGCDLNSKSAVQRVRQIKQLSNNKPLTFLCSSLSNIAHYALVSNSAYRIMKSLVPGPYTFILPTTKLVPRLVMDPKRKTTGIRVPDHVVSQTLIQALGNPIISTSANLSDRDDNDNGWNSNGRNGVAIKRGKSVQACDLPQAELFDRFDKLVDIIIDDGSEPHYEVSTIVDLTTDEPEIVRQGLGSVEFMTV